MDYKNGKIYKILNTITDDVYVGSTCQPLSKRMAKHRETLNTRKGHTLLYTKMKQLGVYNFYIELIEECPCDNIEQLRAVEGKYIREFSTLNKRIENRSKKQYTEDTKEQKMIYDREYRRKNEEKIKESHTCHICGGNYQNKSKQKHFRTKKHLKAVASQTDDSYENY